jgi:hypothetical protein
MPEPIPSTILAIKEKTTNIVLDSTNIRKPSPKMPITLKVKESLTMRSMPKIKALSLPIFHRYFPVAKEAIMNMRD